MTNKVSKSKSGVRAAREAVKASQREVLERAARNADDLAVFFSSRERLDAVDDWLQAKITGLKVQAEAKRAEHRRTAGLALVALRGRGETLRDIARLTGAGEKSLRELIRCAETGADRPFDPASDVGSGEAVGRTGELPGAELPEAPAAGPMGAVNSAPGEALSPTG